MEKAINIGLDLGNTRLKCSSSYGSFEFQMLLREVDKFDYDNFELRNDTSKVIFNDKYYYVGSGNKGLARNKADSQFREQANIFKMTALAKVLSQAGLTEGSFNIVTGTPIADYDLYKDSYHDFIMDNSENTIVVDGVEYKITIEDAKVLKQGAVVVPRIKNYKEKDIVLLDLGGGTLDVSVFNNGTIGDYATIDFSLNNILVDLGNNLNTLGLGLQRPSFLDSNYINSIEEIVATGEYRGLKFIDDNNVAIKDYIDEFLQGKVDDMLESVSIMLSLSKTDEQTMDFYFIGGGTKLLKEYIAKNEQVKSKTTLNNPHYQNVETYHYVSNLIWSDNDESVE